MRGRVKVVLAAVLAVWGGAPAWGAAAGGAREQLRAELDALLRTAVVRPYGTAFSEVAEPGGRGPVVDLDAGATPAAGLILHLSGALLGEARYSEAAVAVARGVGFSMDPAGRVPATAVFNPGQLGVRASAGEVAKRGPTTAAMGLLLVLDRDLDRAGRRDERVASAAVRATNYLMKQQMRNGAFASGLEVGGERYVRRVVRLDTPDHRDAVMALLLVQRSADGRDTSLPVALARINAAKAVEQLLRFRVTEVGKASRHLWLSAYEPDGTPVANVPVLPATGNIQASRYVVQALMAYHLETGDPTPLDVAKVAGEQLASRKGEDGLWGLVDNPGNRFPPPPELAGPAPAPPAPGEFVRPVEGPAWPLGTFGVPTTLRTLEDLRTLGRQPFNTLTARTLPGELVLASILTGLSDQLPTADLPLRQGQVAAYRDAHPETFAALSGAEPVKLSERVRRLWALYLLASWEMRFAAPATAPAR